MVALPETSPIHDIPRPITYHEWLDLPEDSQRMELWAGAVILSPAPQLIHQDIESQLGYALMTMTRKKPGAKLFYESNVRLSEHTVVEPDIVIFTGHAGGKLTERAIEGAPDMVVEILSPSSRRRDLVQKTALYAEAGIPEYWIVDPEHREVIVGRLREGHYERTIVKAGMSACDALGGAPIDIGFLSAIGDDAGEPPTPAAPVDAR